MWHQASTWSNIELSVRFLREHNLMCFYGQLYRCEPWNLVGKNSFKDDNDFLNKILTHCPLYIITTAFIFDSWTDVLVKVLKSLRQKMSRPEGNSIRTPTLWIHAECSNHLAYKGETLLVTACLLPRIREFIHTQHRRPSAVLWC